MSPLSSINRMVGQGINQAIQARRKALSSDFLFDFFDNIRENALSPQGLRNQFLQNKGNPEIGFFSGAPPLSADNIVRDSSLSRARNTIQGMQSRGRRSFSGQTPGTRGSSSFGSTTFTNPFLSNPLPSSWGPSLDELTGSLPSSWGGSTEGLSVEGLNFSVAGNASNARGMEGAMQHRKLAERAARETGVPAALILAVMGLESGGRNNLTSPAGAQGLMQIMPNYWSDTAQRVAGSRNLMDPWVNIRTGAEILKSNRDRWGSWENAVKAYLAGTPHSTAVDAYGTGVNSYAQIIADNLAWIQRNSTVPTQNPEIGFNAGSTGQGSSAWNLFGGNRYTITQEFGHTRFSQTSGGYGDAGHDGIDIGVPQGTALRAGVSGTVEFVGVKGGYGGTVQIRTASGHVIKMSHLSQFNVRQGQKVSANDVIGLSGGGGGGAMAGWSTGPHLHLTVYNPQGQVINPRNYFRF